jgi:GAF domain-containing protein
VVVISACTTLLFALPIVIVGSPLYPSDGWRGVVLWSLISLFVGLGADRVMRAQQEQIEIAEARARELDRLAETQRAIATTNADLDAVLGTVVREAQRLTDADAAVVEIPDGDDLVYRAVAGTAAAHLGVRIPAAGAISGLALRTGETLLCEDSETERVDRETCRRVGARSMVVVPLRHAAQTAGVLKVYSQSQSAFRPEHVRVLTLLADMIGSALVRAALLEKLEHLALTDELTGLPNRRNWYEQLEHALLRARRSRAPLSVIVLDLNGFKQVNDRQGHAAGDRLLAYRQCVLVDGSSRERRSRSDRRRRVRGRPRADRSGDGGSGGRAPRGEPDAKRGDRRHRHRHLGEPGGRSVPPLTRRRGHVQPEERSRAGYAVLSGTGQATPVPPRPQ